MKFVRHISEKKYCIFGGCRIKACRHDLLADVICKCLPKDHGGTVMRQPSNYVRRNMARYHHIPSPAGPA